MHFEHGDIVVSESNNGMNVEAVVDFEYGDKVYISEWGKNLANPVRYVVDPLRLHKKEKGKLVIPLQEMNALMASVLALQGADYSNEPSIDKLEIGQVLTCDRRTYKYAGKLNGEPVRDSEGYFCVIDKDDLSKLFWNREDICNRLFGLGENDIIVEGFTS